MSTTRMMILGLVNWLQPVHGYDVRRELLSWESDDWANIQPGSIYHALRKMAEEGLLQEVKTEQVGSRPARTTYRMTNKGVLEFEELLRKYWWNVMPAVDPFAAAFAFLPALPRAEAIAALRNRARSLEAKIERHRVFLENSAEWVEHKPPHVNWQLEMVVVQLEAQVAWCRRTAEKIEAGQGFHAHEPGTDEIYQAWRESGATDAKDD